MPHHIVQDPDGTLRKVPGNDPTILTNIILSLEIRMGSWWNDPAFGLKWRGSLKNTSTTEKVLADDCRRALQWLLDTGRAKSIQVTTQRNPGGIRDRLSVFVDAVQANGQRVAFQRFIEVI